MWQCGSAERWHGRGATGTLRARFPRDLSNTYQRHARRVVPLPANALQSARPAVSKAPAGAFDPASARGTAADANRSHPRVLHVERRVQAASPEPHAHVELSHAREDPEPFAARRREEAPPSALLWATVMCAPAVGLPAGPQWLRGSAPAQGGPRRPSPGPLCRPSGVELHVGHSQTDRHPCLFPPLIPRPAVSRRVSSSRCVPSRGDCTLTAHPSLCSPQGYLPANVDRRPATLQRKQKEYFTFIERYYDSRNDEVHQDTYRQVGTLFLPRVFPAVL